MSSPDDNYQSTEEATSLTDEVTDTGVFRIVLDGYDAIYDALHRSETFNRLWRANAYGAEFPEEFAHIGFFTVAEAQRMGELLQLGTGDVFADLACGAGGPGLWMAKQSGASLIGADPSGAGLSAAQRRARAAGLADRSRFQQGSFEQTNLPDGAVDAAMSVDAFQYAPDKRAALAEFFRILRPGGRMARPKSSPNPKPPISHPIAPAPVSHQYAAPPSAITPAPARPDPRAPKKPPATPAAPSQKPAHAPESWPSKHG